MFIICRHTLKDLKKQTHQINDHAEISNVPVDAGLKGIKECYGTINIFCAITVKRYKTLRVTFNKVPKTSNMPKDQLHYC